MFFEPFEDFVGVEVDGDVAVASTVVNEGDAGAEGELEALEEGAGFEVLGDGLGLRDAGFGGGLLLRGGCVALGFEVAGAGFGLTDGELFFDHLVEERGLSLGLEANELTGVTLGQLACGEGVLGIVAELEEAEGVGNGAAGLSEALGELLLGVVVLVREAFEGLGHLEGGEIFALEVLDEGEGKGVGVGGFFDDGGELGEAGDACGAPSAFTGDELVVSSALSDDDGLEDTALLDGLSELGEPFVIEVPSRLTSHGGDAIDGAEEESGASGDRRRGGDQCTNPFSQRVP